MIDRLVPKGKKIRMSMLMIVDIFMILFSSFLGLWIRFDMQISSIPLNYVQAVKDYTPFYISITINLLHIAAVLVYVERGRNEGRDSYCYCVYSGISVSNFRDDNDGIAGS